MRRPRPSWATALVVATVAIVATNGAPAFARAGETLVLPLRSIGVSDTTVTVVGDLLQGDLERHGVAVVPASRLGTELPRGEAACEDAECAAKLATTVGAAQVVYGSVSRLGDKIIVRMRALRSGEDVPYYVESMTATSEEDLDVVVRRLADGIAAGRSNSERATVQNVTNEETLEPRRRASRSGLGLRAGFLFPVEDSYAGIDRLATARLSFKYETPSYFIDSTPILGFAWSGETVEWTIFDLFAARIFGKGDFAPFAGAGLGVHSLNVEKKVMQSYVVGSSSYSYETSQSQSTTTLTADAGIGFIALRTYDFSIVVDVRYHYVFADFNEVGGNGAQAIAITFGTSR